MKQSIWKRGVALGTAIVLSLTAGCGVKQEATAAEATGESTEEKPAEVIVATEAATETAAETETAATETPEQPQGDPLYQELSNWLFTLSSGAGAWETTFSVESDGSFSGQYHDSDMGDTGEGYEDGSVYVSDFSGSFGGYTKVSNTVYELDIESIEYKNTPGTEEISDGMRYIYDKAYGLEGADSLIVYLPGTPTADLPEGYMNWVTPLYFRAYVDDENYLDVPADLPFCGLYNQKEDLGMVSSSVAAKNTRFLINRAVFPGVHSVEQTLNEDGTYRYEDADEGGLWSIINLCFPVSEDISLYSDEDKFAEACISELTDGYVPEDYFKIGLEDEFSQEKTYINGERCMELSFTTGSNEDTTKWVARVMEKAGNEPGKGYAYVYAIYYDADGEFMNGEVADFLMTSLSVSGSPEHLSMTSNDVLVERVIQVEAKVGSDESKLEADEVEIVGAGDTDKMELYGIKPEDITNDYAIGGFDEDFKEYTIAEGCNCFVQYPDNPFHKLKTREEFHDYLMAGETARLMTLYLDEKDQVVFIYEPYTP